MPQINLLPWRETLKEERETRFGIMTGIALFCAGLVVLSVHLFMSGEIAYQQKRNKYLEKQIAIADEKIKEIDGLEEEKQQMILRKEVIEDLEKSRPQIVHLIEEIVKRTPEGLYFDSLIQKKDVIILTGFAQSQNRVSRLLTNLGNSEWITKPTFYTIKEAKNKKKAKNKEMNMGSFKIDITQSSPEKKARENKSSAE